LCAKVGHVQACAYQVSNNSSLTSIVATESELRAAQLARSFACAFLYLCSTFGRPCHEFCARRKVHEQISNILVHKHLSCAPSPPSRPSSHGSGVCLKFKALNVCTERSASRRARLHFLLVYPGTSNTRALLRCFLGMRAHVRWIFLPQKPDADV
jgi:hypothetical protein